MKDLSDHYTIPNNTSTEKVAEELKKIEHTDAARWNNEIDTLLVFAGLFSAVLTAFLVEQLKALKEDPATTTANILKHIINPNTTQPIEPPPTASDITINTLWAMSLLLSLAAALFGLLCKQWISNYLQVIPTCTHTEFISVLWMRHESWNEWDVPKVLAVLPILLQISLLMFFAGFLTQLSSLHWVPFGFSLLITAASVGFYVYTTFRPAAILVQQSWRALTQRSRNSDDILKNIPVVPYTCPYKSPQALLVFSCIRLLIKTDYVTHIFHRLSRTNLQLSDFRIDLKTIDLYQSRDWGSLDLHVVRSLKNSSLFELGRRREENENLEDKVDVYGPPLHEIQAVGWALDTFRESLTMKPCLDKILRSIPSPLVSLVPSSGFRDWKVRFWKQLDTQSLVKALNDGSGSTILPFSSARQEVGLDPDTQDQCPSFTSPILHQAMVYQYMWNLASDPRNMFDFNLLKTASEELYKYKHILEETGSVFIVPFHMVEKLLLPPRPDQPQPTPYPEVVPEGNQKLGLDLLDFYKKGWNLATPRLTAKFKCNHDQLALTKAVIRHLSAADIEESRSVLWTSKQGYNFIHWLQEKILADGLYENGDWRYDEERVVSKWNIMVERFRNLRAKLTGTSDGFPWDPIPEV